jgi:hypothetical protein
VARRFALHTRPDLTPALGTWFNCNLETREILSLSRAEGDGGLILRAFFTSEGDSLSS